MLLSGLLTGTASRSVLQRRSWFTGWKTDTEKSGFTSEEEKAIVEIHNELRLRVNASDMRQQSWDPSLATDAQSWADGCDYASDNRTSYGENLAAQPLHFHETKAVENWYSEGQHYVYSNNSCTQVCEHYTQVVLAESSRLGCGIKYCSNFTTLTLSDAYFIVCYYDQAYNNSRVPYREGAVCSSCPSDAPICDNSFCRQRNMNDTTTTEITTETTTTSTTHQYQEQKTTVTTMSSKWGID
ncbi:glioma pathogenesis-related protein 1-like [Liolophura sinensis]|uniref:glioma pathogenesis-related protein 1-like n=1 Tax=Liolophura sinensis TaxID=3198878 RepID=UPI0031589963